MYNNNVILKRLLLIIETLTSPFLELRLFLYLNYDIMIMRLFTKYYILSLEIILQNVPRKKFE